MALWHFTIGLRKIGKICLDVNLTILLWILYVRVYRNHGKFFGIVGIEKMDKKKSFYEFMIYSSTKADKMKFH